MKETKNARFRRVAEARVNKIIRIIEPLGHKYMAEVSSDDIKLAMVNVSSKCTQSQGQK